MTKCTVSLHPKGLDPFQAARAWFLRRKLKQSWGEVRKQVHTVAGKVPGKRALERQCLIRSFNLLLPADAFRVPMPNLLLSHAFVL